MLYRTFAHYFNQATGGKPLEQMPPAEVSKTREIALSQASNGTYLGGVYADATINGKSFGDWNVQTIKQDTDNVFNTAEEKIRLSERVIIRSSVLINKFLHSIRPEDEHDIDFATAYLTDSVAMAVYPDWVKRRARCDGCFANGNSREGIDFESGPSGWMDRMPGSLLIAAPGGTVNDTDFMFSIVPPPRRAPR
jgi:hypothetical protein